MIMPSLIRPALRVFLCIAVAALPAMVTGCKTDEDRMRERIAGEYLSEIDETVGGMRHRERHELTLTMDGRWTRNGWGEVQGHRVTGPTDSGTFRIQGVTLNLQSKVEPGMPYRYTINGDTLHSANASFTYAVTGHDIGDSYMVKVR
jgi:hypothetical protein